MNRPRGKYSGPAGMKIDKSTSLNYSKKNLYPSFFAFSLQLVGSEVVKIKFLDKKGIELKQSKRENEYKRFNYHLNPLCNS